MAREIADMAGRALVRFAEGGVEAADAAIACRLGDGGHAQRGLIDQPLGEVKAAGLRDRVRACAEVFEEKTAEVAVADAQAARERFDAALGEPALRDQANRASDSGGGSEPRGSTGRTLRAAAEAGAEAGFGGCGGCGVVADVFFLAASRGADGAAVDAAGADGDEELAVKTRVACEAGAGAGLKIERHGGQRQ